MSTLQYKLEYFKGAGGGASDEGVYIQLRSDPPYESYMSQIGREDYVGLEDDRKTDFLNALFECEGVVELSVSAFRVYVEKSPVFSWSEVLGPVIEEIRIATEDDDIEELPGSPLYLTDKNDRRDP